MGFRLTNDRGKYCRLGNVAWCKMPDQATIESLAQTRTGQRWQRSALQERRDVMKDTGGDTMTWTFAYPQCRSGREVAPCP